MRTQRRTGRDVILRSVTTTEDRLGNETASDDDTTISGAIFEPARTVENVDADLPAVQLSAFFNLPGVHQVDHDDLIVDGATTWSVNGEAQVWLDRTKVPVEAIRTTPPDDDEG